MTLECFCNVFPCPSISFVLKSAGTQRESAARDAKSVAVNVGGIKCMVESQYISNHDFHEVVTSLPYISHFHTIWFISEEDFNYDIHGQEYMPHFYNFLAYGSKFYGSGLLCSNHIHATIYNQLAFNVVTYSRDVLCYVSNIPCEILGP